MSKKWNWNLRDAGFPSFVIGAVNAACLAGRDDGLLVLGLLVLTLLNLLGAGLDHVI
jgi:hypothetical protein